MPEPCLFMLFEDSENSARIFIKKPESCNVESWGTRYQFTMFPFEGPAQVKEGQFLFFFLWEGQNKIHFTKPPLTLLTKGLFWNLRRELLFATWICKFQAMNDYLGIRLIFKDVGTCNSKVLLYAFHFLSSLWVPKIGKEVKKVNG